MRDQILRKHLQRFQEQKIKKQKYKDYYDGKHDILRKYAMADSRSNYRVVVNFFRKFIQDEIAYALGNPVNYVDSNEDHEAADLIEQDLGYWTKVHDQELMLQTNIYGEAYELKYINRDGEFKATVLTPLNAYVVEDGSADNHVAIAMHEYTGLDDNLEERLYLDVYEGNTVTTYDRGNGTSMREVQSTELLGFTQPPVSISIANTERQSLLDTIKSINDSYNTVLSDLVNEVSDFRQAFLKVVGATLSEKDAKEMKKTGIIYVPTSGNNNVDISYLTKQINDTFVQNLLRELEEKLYKLSSHIDTNEKLQSNLSGAALRSRMIALENKCVLMQSMLEQTIRKRLKNYFDFIAIREAVFYDYRKIKIKFTMNIPSDISVLADAIQKLKDIVPHSMLLGLLPFVENPDAALDLFYEEKDRAMQGFIDLDQMDRTPTQTGGGESDDSS